MVLDRVLGDEERLPYPLARMTPSDVRQDLYFPPCESRTPGGEQLLMPQ